MAEKSEVADQGTEAPEIDAGELRVESVRAVNPASGLRLFLVSLFSIFVLEALVMLLFWVVPPLDPVLELFVDATLLSVLAAPIIYVLLHKPLVRELAARRESEAELASHRDQLEQLVEQRTGELTQRNKELEEAVSQVRTLSGIVPICVHCHRVREDRQLDQVSSDSWRQIEHFIQEHTAARFSHGICPECANKHYSDLFEEPPNNADPGGGI